MEDVLSLEDFRSKFLPSLRSNDPVSFQTVRGLKLLHGSLGCDAEDSVNNEPELLLQQPHSGALVALPEGLGLLQNLCRGLRYNRHRGPQELSDWEPVAHGIRRVAEEHHVGLVARNNASVAFFLDLTSVARCLPALVRRLRRSTRSAAKPVFFGNEAGAVGELCKGTKGPVETHQGQLSVRGPEREVVPLLRSVGRVC